MGKSKLQKRGLDSWGASRLFQPVSETPVKPPTKPRQAGLVVIAPSISLIISHST
jgi:hypothetical protein